MNVANFIKTIGLAAHLGFFCSLLFTQVFAQAPPLSIAEEPLPPLVAGVEFHVLLHATGGAAPYVWSVASGELPDGVSLTPEGLLSGRPAQAGSYTLTLTVEDSARPGHTVTKEFRAVVAASLLLQWLEPPKVRDNRIEGALQVSNGTSETFDLTIVVAAIADNGRATAIGYEHFPMKPGTNNLKVPFGNTLPHGCYVVHADAIAEIPARNTILRQRLQTLQALQVVQGP